MSGTSSLSTAILVVFYIVLPIILLSYLKRRMSGVREFTIKPESDDPLTPQPKKTTK